MSREGASGYPHPPRPSLQGGVSVMPGAGPLMRGEALHPWGHCERSRPASLADCLRRRFGGCAALLTPLPHRCE